MRLENFVSFTRGFLLLRIGNTDPLWQGSVFQPPDVPCLLPIHSFTDRAYIQITDRRFRMTAMADRTGGFDIGELITAVIQAGIHLGVALFQRIHHAIQNKFDPLLFRQQLQGNPRHTQQRGLFPDRILE